VRRNYGEERTQDGDDGEPAKKANYSPSIKEATEVEQVAWIWCLFFAYAAPEVLSFLRSTRIILFKHWARPPFLDFAFVLAMEAASAAGTAILFFLALPQLTSTHGLALTTCLGVVPALLITLSRMPSSMTKDWKKWLVSGLDVTSLILQLSGIMVIS